MWTTWAKTQMSRLGKRHILELLWSVWWMKAAKNAQKRSKNRPCGPWVCTALPYDPGWSSVPFPCPLWIFWGSDLAPWIQVIHRWWLAAASDHSRRGLWRAAHQLTEAADCTEGSCKWSFIESKTANWPTVWLHSSQLFSGSQSMHFDMKAFPWFPRFEIRELR